MDIKSKVIVLIFILALLSLFGYQYKKDVIDRDYIINTTTYCDDAKFSCFKYVCSEEDGADCEDEIYARIVKNVKNAESCNQYTNDCADLICEEGEESCKITYCSEEELGEGEICTVPVISDLITE